MNLDRHHPKQFLDWAKTDKMVIGYFDKVNMSPKAINLTEIFDQMNSSQKIYAVKNMFAKLLDEDEKSMFLSEINSNVTGKIEHQEEQPKEDDDECEHDF